MQIVSELCQFHHFCALGKLSMLTNDHDWFWKCFGFSYACAFKPLSAESTNLSYVCECSKLRRLVHFAAVVFVHVIDKDSSLRLPPLLHFLNWCDCFIWTVFPFLPFAISLHRWAIIRGNFKKFLSLEFPHKNTFSKWLLLHGAAQKHLLRMYFTCSC